MLWERSSFCEAFMGTATWITLPRHLCHRSPQVASYVWWLSRGDLAADKSAHKLRDGPGRDRPVEGDLSTFLAGSLDPLPSTIVRGMDSYNCHSWTHWPPDIYSPLIPSYFKISSPSFPENTPYSNPNDSTGHWGKLFCSLTLYRVDLPICWFLYRIMS